MTATSCTLYSNFSTYRAVTSLIIPFQCAFFESPLQAFRFVSLIPLEEESGRWSSFHATAAKGSGSLEDHCTLLCSLLLGFGLDAYVAVGNGKEEARIWVLTRETMVSAPVKAVYFWEPATGQRLESSDSRIAKYCKALTCVFNDKRICANTQLNNSMFNVSYNFEDSTCWSSIEVGALATPWNFPVKLHGPTVNAREVESKLEKALQSKIKYYRGNTLMVSTEFDEEMSYMLKPAAAKCELEKVYEIKQPQEELEAAMYSRIPDGHVFKAYPLFTRSVDPQEVFAELMQNKTTRKLIDTSSDNLKFALKTKVIPYPENITVAWTILAITHPD